MRHDEGSATVQGALWGAAVPDWAAICEPWSRPLFAATLAALAPLRGLSLLDAGCGSGLALTLAEAAGARVSGLDAAAPMIALARDRLPGADLRVGDLQFPPYADATFDVVTAFNALQFAADPPRALAGLARVTRPGGRVAISLWGDPARCDTDTVFRRIRAYAPPQPGGTAPLAISAPGVLDDLLARAGLTTTDRGEVTCPFTFPDLDTGWRGQSSIGPFQSAIEAAGADVVRAAFEEVVAQFRRPDGSYRQENVFQYVITTVA